MNRMARGAAAERVNHRLEPLLEVAAEARAREERGRVEREDFRAFEQVRARPRRAAGSPGPRPSRSCRRRLRRRRPGCSSAAGRGLRSCAAVRRRGRSADRAARVWRDRSGSCSTPPADRVTAAGPSSSVPAVASWPVEASLAEVGTFEMPCEMYSRTSSRVTPCASSSRAACAFGCCRIAARMSPACTSCRCALCTCSTAVCSTRRNAAVCSGSRSCPRRSCSIESSR